jgi:ABC-type bacteriocin/lantibiotic exporter with double-glycine peptidase domain
LNVGYDTQVGPDGSLLSGGQAARIAIARSLVKKPTFLILDESTASLDPSSQAGIISVLTTLSKKVTIIVFTHSKFFFV